VDTLNENYAQYYKHAITTDFEGDVVKWSIVQVLLVVRYVQDKPYMYFLWIYDAYFFTDCVLSSLF